MRYIMILLMCIPIFVSLFGVSGEFKNGSIVIEFPNNLNPKVEKGVVVTGHAALDSLNAALGATEFEYYDFNWTSRLQYILVLHFDKSRSIDVKKEVSVYAQATYGLSTRVEYMMYPEILSTPGEYLYSNNIYHPEDTIWKIYNNGDDKRNWRTNQRYQKLNSNGFWEENNKVLELYDDYWGPTNPVVVDELNRPFPYHWAFHGHSSLWHHLGDYNNTYKAWDYTEGKGTIAIIIDWTGFWTQHPDLRGHWLQGYPQYTNDGLIPPIGTTPTNYISWWADVFHGTSCAGALAAGKEDIPESGLTNRSSVGVAPQTMLLGRDYGPYSCLNNLHQHTGLKPAVISISYSIGWSQSEEDVYHEMIDMGVSIVASRGYKDALSNASLYGDRLDGFIAVGDYRPDWRVMTAYATPDTSDTVSVNYNEVEDAFKAEISAPGWEVWVPNIYHTAESRFTEIGYGLAMGTNTSIAAPQVAGVVCLIKSLYPWMSPAQVERQIKLGAHHLSDLIVANATYLPSTPESFYGAGCLDAYGSLFLHGDFDKNLLFSGEPSNSALIGTEFILNNSSMTVTNGTVRIEKDAHAILDNSSLILGDNVTVLFEKGAKLELSSNSSLIVGNNVTFRTENNEPCQGLVKYGNNTQTLTFNNTTFINVPIEINNTEAEYNGCTFTRSNIIHNNECMSINYCNLEFSGINSIQTSPDPDDLCWIRNSQISNAPITGIAITGYSKIKIENNNIHHNYSGIELYECPGGYIVDNEISFNGNGIQLYHSNAIIMGHNNVTYNYRSTPYGNDRGGHGIDAKHLTCWNLMGQNTYPVQVIHDNQREQILIQANSIPSSMYFNKVYSSNHSYPYMRMWDTYNGDSRIIDISNNNWSDDFIPGRDFDSTPEFTYLPIWEPGIPLQTLEDEAVQLFLEGMAAAGNQQYVVAEQKLKQVIAEYPETNACIDATKQLLNLIETYNQNYQALELYYQTYPTLRNDPVLAQIADYLANYCTMKSGDYPEAIQFFENIIQSPPSLPDSIYAVIDAGYAYLLMSQNSSKASYVGKLKNLKPASVKDYVNLRDALLNNRQIVKPDSTELPINLPNTVSLNNYPNPFNPRTTITFSLTKPSNVVLEVYNIKGQKVKKLIQEQKDAGSHHIVWDGDDQSGRKVSSGVYFYRLTTNGKVLTKRMLLLK